MVKKNEVAVSDTSATEPALNGEIMEPVPAVPPKEGRQHRASFSRDKNTGGFNIWVEGPSANKFAGKYVPVTLFDGTEQMEKCLKLTWTGISSLTDKPAAVYTFLKKARPKKDDGVTF
jgi:hypothetical protein